MIAALASEVLSAQVALGTARMKEAKRAIIISLFSIEITFSAQAWTGVRVPSMMGSLLKMAGSVTM